MKKILAISAVLLVVIAIFTVSVSASFETYSVADSGLTWSLNQSTGHLTISGNGEMVNFFDHNEMPWANYRNSIKSLTVSEGVTSIGDYAFCYLQSLNSVSLPSSLTHIGEYAFYGCTSLTAVTLPEKLESLGTASFGYCGLKTAVIPRSVKLICNAVLYGCSNLSRVTIENPLATMLCESGSFANATIYGYNNSSAKAYASKYNRKFSSLEDCTVSGSCGDSATWSYYTGSGTLTINGSGRMYDFDKTAPDWMGAMEEIKIVAMSGSITHVGALAFSGATYLQAVTLSNKLVSIGENAFYACRSLQSVSLPNTLESIGDFAFTFCTALKDVTGGSSLVSIGEEAFSNCHNLSTINIADTIEYIGSSAFYACDSLRYTQYKYGYYLGNSQNPYAVLLIVPYYDLTDCQINPNTKVIYDEAFMYCEALETLSIPDGVAYVGANAFSGCPNLEYNRYHNGYYLGNENTPYLILVKAFSTDIESCEIHPTTKIIYKSAFENCLSLKGAVIPERVVLIDDYAFKGCAALKEVTLPDSVRRVGISVFNGCSGLESVTLSDGMKRVGNYMFSGCSSLKNVDMGSGVESIGYEAFYFCTSLTDVVIPNSVITIENEAFFGCTALKSLTLGKNLAIIDAYAFEFCPSLTNIYDHSTALKLSPNSAENGGIALNAKNLLDVRLRSAAPGLGADLSLTVYADISATIDTVDIPAAEVPQYVKLRVTMNGKTTDLVGTLVSGNQYSFKFKGIAPQCIGDEIDLALVYNDGEKDVIIDTIEDYSIVQYCQKLMTLTAAQLGTTQAKFDRLKTLIADLVAYSTAAQDYINYKVDAKPTVSGATPSAFVPLTGGDTSKTATTVPGLNFKAATLYFYSTNVLQFDFEATDITGVTVKINGKERAFTCIDPANNLYRVETDDIYAIEFEDVYTIELLKNGEVAQTLTYSVKSYVYSKQGKTDGSGNPTAMAILAQRTWNYGLSAKAYAAK